jgi:N-acyl-D-aspartate/D-glutamate deacylase
LSKLVNNQKLAHMTLRRINMGLSDKISDQNTQANLVADCAKLMDEQVAAKNGISGLALKAAYGVVKGIGPNYIPGALHGLLPAALVALDPIWDEGVQSGDPVEHLAQNRSRTADMLLSITDARIEKARNGAVRASYNRLRKSVKNDVEEAVPGLAKILGAHVQA